MKIQKFNENKAYQKNLKVIFSGEVIVDVEDVEKTDAYYNYINNDEIGETPEELRDSALYYGLEEYLHENGNPMYNFTLVDGNGDEIENEEEFDKINKDINKYNM